MDRILDILKRTEAIVGLVSIVAYLVISNVNLRCDRSELQEANLILHNELADKDTLKQVLGDSVNVLSERLARQEKDLNKTVAKNSLLAQRLREKDGELLATAELLAEVRLEKVKIEGKLSDSSGYSADFADSNPFYTLTASVHLKPVPVLDLHELLVFDSSSVSFYTAEGYTYGTVERTNPYIRDLGATFRVPIQKLDEGGFNLQWYEILGGAGAIVILTLLAQ